MEWLEKCRVNPNMCVPYILMASFLYYCRDITAPTSDGEFDQICKLALENWRKIKHRHKGLIKKSNLEAGSLYNLPEYKYPTMVKCAAFYWLEHGDKPPEGVTV